MAYISGTKIVPNMGFVQKHSKLYKFSLQKKIIKSYRQNFSINSKNPVFGPFLVHFPKFPRKRLTGWAKGRTGPVLGFLEETIPGITCRHCFRGYTLLSLM